MVEIDFSELSYASAAYHRHHLELYFSREFFYSIVAFSDGGSSTRYCYDLLRTNERNEPPFYSGCGRPTHLPSVFESRRVV